MKERERKKKERERKKRKREKKERKREKEKKERERGFQRKESKREREKEREKKDRKRENVSISDRITKTFVFSKGIKKTKKKFYISSSKNIYILSRIFDTNAGKQLS
jgi:hypothetical protein